MIPNRKIELQLPMAPVANVLIPTELAMTVAPATVVPPFNFLPSTKPRSQRDVLIVGIWLGCLANISNCSSVRPTLIRPFMIPIVAGTAF